ncbi:arginine--tRNA ligase [Anaplasma phagocytophilum]|uniref:Arginine--tRNA ligase n=2 Tax=Anaplasma phagocytophilum TaxID=948 RepID=A0A0F3NLT1_ANAPH|nr:arginine--tRNA ligase [Anaplasma phagocytophilum str. ApMUC09]KJV67854.1 arginine--tRNA ligase [Anaplasma phagocytophilum str. ApNP]SCV63634.1 Arginine--tRNA ligase [Anaplasma phagocytophilum]
MLLDDKIVDIFGFFRSAIEERIRAVWSGDDIPESLFKRIIVGPPAQPKHGDLYTNAALILGKFDKKNPMELASTLCNAFENIEGVESINVVAPGFINFHCVNSVWHGVIRNINKLGREYGRTDLGHNKKINIEFVSANPTGPLHIGHARGAVFGDVLSNLLKWVGYDVTKEYYVNDAGSQVKTLVSSVFLRYKEALGEEITIGAGLYPGEYLKPIARDLVEKYGSDLLNASDKDEIIRSFTLSSMLNLIKEDLALLGVEHDVFVSESDLQNRNVIEECVKYLRERGIIYEGVLEKPKREDELSEWQPRVQMLFKSTEFGDDSDRALQKEDGTWSYFAGDIGYHFHKISRGFDSMIMTLGFDHKGYVSRLKAAVSALSNGKASIDIKLYNLVNFLENGIPVKMSKRKGEFLTVRDVIDEVGRDVARFIMLTRRNDVVLDFDFAKAREESKDSQIFYIQYAHARIRSIVRRCPELLAIEKIDFSCVITEQELSLLRLLSRWPSVIKTSAENYEPHTIAFYLIEVAEAFHALWGCGNSDPSMRFIVEGDLHTTSARIYIAIAVSHVIASGLDIFSITPSEEMR